MRAPFCVAPSPCPRTASRLVRPDREVIHFPAPGRVRPRDIWLVYLTWIQTPPRTRLPAPPGPPTLGQTSGADASLSSRLSNLVRIGRDNAHTALSSQIPQPDRMVGRGGLEPPTSRLSGVRSNHLSYRPTSLVEPSGIEPLTLCLQSRCSPS